VPSLLVLIPFVSDASDIDHLTPKPYGTHTSISVPPNSDDMAYGNSISKDGIRDPLNRKIPDGMYLFMATDVPKSYWEKMNPKLEKYHAKYVMYGFSKERFDRIKKLSDKYLKAGKVPKDRKELYDIFPWHDSDMLFKPAWFDVLSVKSVPAFILKGGDVVCIVKGSASFDMAIREFVIRDCPVIGKWAAKFNFDVSRLQ